MKTLLGPFGAGTVVLFKAQFATDLPKKTDLKKLLRTSDVNLYKSRGHGSEMISTLENALDIARGYGSGEKRDSLSHKSTDFIVLRSGVSGNAFFQLKYAAQLIEGFNLTEKSLAYLKNLNSRFSDMKYIETHYARWVDTAERNIATLEAAGIKDETVSSVPLSLWKKDADLYGVQAVEIARKSITDWVDKWVWQAQPPAMNSQTNKVVTDTALT